MIKGNRRTAAPESGLAWPGRLPVSKYPGSVWRAVRASPLVRLALHSYIGLAVMPLPTGHFMARAHGDTSSTAQRHAQRLRWVVGAGVVVARW